MKWKCVECVAFGDSLDNFGCELDVGHIDESCDGPPDCPWNSDQEALWFPLDEPIDKAIEAATPSLCCRCKEPALVDHIGYCVKCLQKTGGV